MKYIKGLSLEEKLKLKNPNKDGEADIDFVEVKPGDLKKMAKKHKLDADEYEPGMVMLKGKKKDIVSFLKDRDYDMADQDIEGIFPELLEAKKFKPGDMWSDDFDYDGMLKFALTVNEKTPIKKLNQLFDSATDVNYHTPFRNLGIAIDWIEDGDKKGAKDYIKMFHKDIKDEIKRQS
jgi:hypothetical protein